MSKREITVPMSGEEMPNIDFNRAQLGKLIREADMCVSEIIKNEKEINIMHARDLNVLIQVRNIRNTAASLAMYVGIIEMLLSNMESDIKSIYISQKLWKENELRRLVQLDLQQAQLERNNRDKENKKKKASEIADAQTE